MQMKMPAARAAGMIVYGKNKGEGLQFCPIRVTIEQDKRR